MRYLTLILVGIVAWQAAPRPSASPADAPVEFLVVQGGGHSWPGSEFGKAAESIVGPTDMSIDATDVIWKFFQRFALPAS